MQPRRVFGRRRGLRQRRAGRHHRVEQRQRQRHAGAAQERAPREVLLRDERHGCAPPSFLLHLERHALHDPGDERREPVVVAAPRRARSRARPACRSTRPAGPARRLAASPWRSRRRPRAGRAAPAAGWPGRRARCRPPACPAAFTGTPPSVSRHFPIRSKFSSEKPIGSITAWHDGAARVGPVRSSRWRSDVGACAVVRRTSRDWSRRRAAATAPARRAGSRGSTCRA